MLVKTAIGTGLISLCMASLTAPAWAKKTSYKLSIESNKDPSLNGKHVELNPVKTNAGVYTANIGKQQEESPFWLNGTILYTHNDDKALFAQLDQPVDTYAALTFNDAGPQGEANFYKVQNDRLIFQGDSPLEWFSCGENQLIALYPYHAPQEGCKGINITAVPATGS